MIPHIRSVIVLDDNTPDGFGEDEPWEYVLNPDSKPNKGVVLCSGGRPFQVMIAPIRTVATLRFALSIYNYGL